MRRTTRAVVLLAILAGLVMATGPSAPAQPGTFVATVNFNQPCAGEHVGGFQLGVGIAFDGTYLWYSCYGSVTDLYRTDTAGVVNASYDLVPGGGLGALSYDATRNVIWAGDGFGGPSGEIYKITLDGAKNATGIVSAGNVTSVVGGCGLDDGLAFDANLPGPADDVLYYSNDCGTTTIRSFAILPGDLVGGVVESFAWAGTGCYNSGLAVGGQLLYQGSDGCSMVWVIDKVSKAPAYNFSTVVAGDPQFRDEDLECDTKTFAGIGKHVMWSKEAYAPMRAHAFEIEFGSCGIGGEPPKVEGRMTGGGSVFTAAGVRVTHGFELHCDASKLPNNLQVNWGKGSRFHLTSLTSASCSDNTLISEGNPVAGFDTYTGSGTGNYNGVPGATATWTFTDAGEPGTADSVDLTIQDASSTTVLTVTGTLTNGNQQAHP